MNAPSEGEGSGPAYGIDPRAGDDPPVVGYGMHAFGTLSSAKDKTTEAAREPAAEFAEIRGFCSVATRDAIVLALALTRDEQSSLEYRLSRPATGSDNDEVLNVVTKWKPLSPP